MSCSEAKKWADRVEEKIKKLDQVAAAQAEKDQAIKRMITGLAKSLESIGFGLELGYAAGGGSVKIVLHPKHTQTVGGAFEVWKGWTDYQKAGGKVPTLAATRAMLVKAQTTALEQYQKCLDSQVWSGFLKATFTERANYAGPRLYQEIHKWTTSGKPSAQDPQDYPCSWEVTVKMAENLTDAIGTRTVVYPTEKTSTFKSRLTISVTDDRYTITCGYNGKQVPNALPYDEHFVNSDGSSGVLAGLVHPTIEKVAGAQGALPREGAAVKGVEEGDTLWSEWEYLATPGVTHRLKTEWSFSRSP
jgi:hypothetical protein